MAEDAEEQPVFETSTGPVRVITAASLFDGHDAAINVMRRLIQSRVLKSSIWDTIGPQKMWLIAPFRDAHAVA